MQFKLLFPYLLLLARVSSTGQVYQMNSTFNWPSQTVLSYILNQSSNYYHNVTDNGYGMLNVKTFTQYTSFPGAKTQWNNTNSYELLGNGCYQFLLKTSFSINWESWQPNYSGYLISIIVKYRDSQGNKSILIAFSVSWDGNGAGSVLTTGTSATNQSTVIFSIATNPNPSDLWIYPQSFNHIMLQSYNEEFDVIGLVRAVKAHFNTHDNFFVTSINPRIETNNLKANIDLNVSKTISQTTCCEPSSIILKNTPIGSQVFQNVTKPNYCRILFRGSELSHLQFAFNFQNILYSLKVVIEQMQSYQFVAYGYLNKQWLTPIGTYQLPLQLTNRAEIKVNFTYSFSEVVVSKTAVCFTIVLRDDYDFRNKSFNLNQTNPSAEIVICPWWKTDLLNSKRMKNIRLANDQFYSMYITYANWPLFTFISLVPLSQTVQNFNLFDYVKQVLTLNPDFSNHYIACIQMGFRAYSGMGVFSIQQSTLQVKIIPPYQNDVVAMAQCLIQNFENQPSGKKCHVGATIYQTVNQIMSTPNLALIVRMVCALRLIDDLTYYAYHKNNYDKRFRGLSLLAWNLTSSKWMIPQLKPVYEKFDFTYQSGLSKDPTFLIPNSYYQLGQDANLLRQTEDFWLSSLPLTVIIFILIHFLYLFLSHFQFTRKFSNIFIRFKWFGFLTISIIGDNIQYLSFRCFSQLYQLLPSTNTQIATIVTSHVSLFFVIFYAAGAYYMLPVFIAKHSSMLVEGFKERFKTANYLTLVCGLRVFSGFVHSSLGRDSMSQIVCLLFIQTTLMFLLLCTQPLYICKSLFTCHFIQSLLRTTLHIILCLEIHQKQLVSHHPIFEQITGTLTQYIFIFCLIDLIVSNTVSGDVFDFYSMTIFHKLKKPKIEQTDRTGRTEEIIAEQADKVVKKIMGGGNNIRVEILKRRKAVNLMRKERALKGVLVKKGKFETSDMLAMHSVRVSEGGSSVSEAKV